MYNVGPEHTFDEIRDPCTTCERELFEWDGHEGVFVCAFCGEEEE